MEITQNSQTALTVTMPEGADTEIYTQFGMRYPDGTIKWGYEHESYDGTLRFENLSTEATAQTWRSRLERRAAAANIQISEYMEGHELLQRTVVVAVTKAEDAK